MIRAKPPHAPRAKPAVAAPGLAPDLLREIEFLRERDRHSHSLLRLSHRLERAESEPACFDAALEELKLTLGRQSAWVYLFDADLRFADLYMGTAPSVARVPVQGDAMMEEFVRTGEMVLVEDARHDPRPDAEVVRRLDIRTLVNVPIVFHGRSLGAVGSGTFGDEGIWHPSLAEQEFLKSVASQLAVSMDRVRSTNEWRRAEEDLRHREALYRSLVSTMAEGVVVRDAGGTITAVNPSAERILGRDAASLLGGTQLFAQAVPGDAGHTLPEDQLPWNLTRGSGLPQTDQVLRVSRPQAPPAWLSFNCQPMLGGHQGPPHAVVITFRDISAERRDMVALQRLNRALTTLSAGNEVLVRAASQGELLERMCRLLVDTGSYPMARIALFGHPGVEAMEAMATAQGEAGLPAPAALQALADEALTCDTPVWVQDVGRGPGPHSWHPAVAGAGFRSVMAFALRDAGQAMGVLTILARQPEAFDAAERRLLAELAEDLAFGLHVLHTKEDRQRAVQRMQRTMAATIKALASTLELRDPYTAGHQQRVAELAVAIARKLNMPEPQIEGLYLAGMIHDIGKISVPSEILCRPGRLSPIEFAMVQTHVEAAYGILQPIDFPWPIAEIVRQHHERLDGSGYPRGLQAPEIRVESRILAVADVVEAMSNHRPYRPGLGIDLALAEVIAHSGRLFDGQVVEACVSLFRQDGFRFTPAGERGPA